MVPYYQRWRSQDYLKPLVMTSPRCYVTVSPKLWCLGASRYIVIQGWHTDAKEVNQKHPLWK